MIVDIFSNFSQQFRSAFRNRLIGLLHVSGLGIGLAVALFLLVYLNFEFSYDTHFPDAERIYRVLTEVGINGKMSVHPNNLDDLASALEKEVPEVEMTGRLLNWGNIRLHCEGGERVNVPVYLVDSTFLRIFRFPVVYGDPLTALNEPGKCVITRRMSERFFGIGFNPIGKLLESKEIQASNWDFTRGMGEMEVAAVIEDIPANTHFQFDLLTKMPDSSLGGFNYYTYFKLHSGVDSGKALEKCNALNRRLLGAYFLNSESRFESWTEPLRSIHVFTRAEQDLTPVANRTHLFFIALVTLFVLGIAISNFISLSMMQGEKRALEISIRKTNGAGRKEIMQMWFGESFLVTLAAFILSIVLYQALVGSVVKWLDFPLPSWEISPAMGMYFILLFLGIAFLAGAYPAYYLSRFRPSDLIRKSAVRRYRLTTASVIVQFSVVIFCVASLLIMERQLDFVKRMPLGYEPENVLTFNLPSQRLSYETLQAELLKYPEIREVAQCDGLPVGRNSLQSIQRWDQQGNESISVDEKRVGRGYFGLFKIPILQGRDFSDAIEADSFAVILSESAVRSLELGDDPVGKKIRFRNQPYTVIGVARDIYYSSLYKKIGDLIYTTGFGIYPTLAVRFEPEKYAEARRDLLSFLKERFFGEPVSLQLTEDLIRQQYRQDQIAGRILTCGTSLAILLALLGLMALMGFVAGQKKKEIGIRRVFGARVEEMVRNLNFYVILRILPAVPIGLSMSYWFISRWLTRFAYTIPLSGWWFILALAMTLGLVMSVLFYQCFRIATANPVDALKNE